MDVRFEVPLGAGRVLAELALEVPPLLMHGQDVGPEVFKDRRRFIIMLSKAHGKQMETYYIATKINADKSLL